MLGMDFNPKEKKETGIWIPDPANEDLQESESGPETNIICHK